MNTTDVRLCEDHERGFHHEDHEPGKHPACPRCLKLLSGDHLEGIFNQLEDTIDHATELRAAVRELLEALGPGKGSRGHKVQMAIEQLEMLLEDEW